VLVLFLLNHVFLGNNQKKKEKKRKRERKGQLAPTEERRGSCRMWGGVGWGGGGWGIAIQPVVPWAWLIAIHLLLCVCVCVPNRPAGREGIHGYMHSFLPLQYTSTIRVVLAKYTSIKVLQFKKFVYVIFFLSSTKFSSHNTTCGVLEWRGRVRLFCNVTALHTIGVSHTYHHGTYG
jgi:hypothetical protein